MAIKTTDEEVKKSIADQIKYMDEGKLDDFLIIDEEEIFLSDLEEPE